MKSVVAGLAIAALAAVVVQFTSVSLASSSHPGDRRGHAASVPSPLLGKEIEVLTREGISPARARQALDLQDRVARTNLPRRLRAAMGSGYAGVWFESAVPRLRVGASTAGGRRTAQAVIAGAGFSSGVVVTPVRSTLAQLLAVQRQWDLKLADLFTQEEVKTGIEPQNNAVSVVLSATVPLVQRVALEQEASAAGANVIVTVQPSSRSAMASEAKECNNFPPGDCNPSITAGVEIWSKITCAKVANTKGFKYFKTEEECRIRKMAREGSEGEWERKSTECTAGPAAIPTAARTERVMLTAGHCVAKAGGEGVEWFAFKRNLEEPLIGKARKFVNGGLPEEKKGDFAEVPIEAGGGWQTGIAGNPVLAVTAEWKKAEETRYPVRGEREPVVGATNCHEGSTSGEFCGKIRRLAVVDVYEGTTKEGLVEDEKAISEPGDSGGPWLAIEPNNEALMEGLHAAKEVTCHKLAAATKGPEYFEAESACLSYTTTKEGANGVWLRLLETVWQPLSQPVPGAGEGPLEVFGLELLTTSNEVVSGGRWDVGGAVLVGTAPLLNTALVLEHGVLKIPAAGVSVVCASKEFGITGGELASPDELRAKDLTFKECKTEEGSSTCKLGGTTILTLPVHGLAVLDGTLNTLVSILPLPSKTLAAIIFEGASCALTGVQPLTATGSLIDLLIHKGAEAEILHLVLVSSLKGLKLGSSEAELVGPRIDLRLESGKSWNFL